VPGPDLRLCPDARPLACNGDMRIEPAVSTTAPQPGHYEIDPCHSRISFASRHLFGLGRVNGNFSILGGSADVAEPLAESAVYAEIATGSFRTSSRARDRSVLSPRFLDSARQPVMIFRSGLVEAEGRTITGDLTVRGTTRPVTLTVTRCEMSGGSFNISATVRIDRTEFGVTAARGLAARTLLLTVDVRCVRR
jgi:polyisoprenoid-binding protein YceI